MSDDMPRRQAFLQSLTTLREGIPTDDSVRLTVSLIQKYYAHDVGVAVELARSLAGSGDSISIGDEVVADVASTGGPSSLSTLLSPLYLRGGGAMVPKLGVPGRPAGGIDCLAQIPRYRVRLSPKEVMSVLESGGYAHFLAEGAVAPLDGRMFRIRQELEAQGVPSLVTASLIAKKMAVGVRFVGLDVRVSSHGNFGTNWEEARSNARLFSQVARTLGLVASPVLTEAAFPCQPYFGRREALLGLRKIFVGRNCAWLSRHQKMCQSLALATVPDSCRRSVAATSPAELQQHFYQNLRDQGADSARFEELVEQTESGHIIDLTSDSDGFFSPRLFDLRGALVTWQRFFLTREVPFPDPVGIVFLAQPGDWLQKGDPVATVRTAREIEREAVDQLRPLLCSPALTIKAPGVEAVHG